MEISETPFPAQLISQPVIGFAEQVAAKSAAPGGGSCAALSGAVGAALLVMVANFTVDKKEYAAVSQRFADLRAKLDLLRTDLLRKVDEDTAAFNRYRVANKLPERDETERGVKAAELRAATQATIDVPLRTMNLCLTALRFAPEIVRDGNTNTASDAATGADMLLSGLRGAAYNVLINLPGIPDSERSTFVAGVQAARQEAAELIAEVHRLIGAKLGV